MLAYTFEIILLRACESMENVNTDTQGHKNAQSTQRMVYPDSSDGKDSHRRRVYGVHAVTWCFLIVKCANESPVGLV